MNTRAYLYLCATAFFWGGNSVAGKMAVGHVSPAVLTTARWTLALSIILMLATPRIRRDWTTIRKHWFQLLAYGAIGFTVFNALLYSALIHTSAINAVIEQAAIPMLILFFNFILFRVSVSPAQIAGFALTLAGVLITAAHGNVATLLQLSFNRGDAMIMAACLVYAAFTLALRWKPDIHWQSFIAASCFGALLSAIPLLVWEIGMGDAVLPDTTGWMVILYAAILPSLVAQVLYVRSVEMIGPNRAGLFINAIPIFGTLLSVALAGETLTFFHVQALLLVLSGIAVAEWGRPR